MSLDYENYIATDEVAIFHAHRSIQEMGTSQAISALLFDGPPGVGKTYLAKHLARKLGAGVIHFQFFPGCDRADILWDSAISSDGILIQAIKRSVLEPTVLILDELDKADVRVDSFLLNFLNEGFVYTPKDGPIRANSKNLLVVLTKNDQRDTSPPLLRRCRAVYMDWPSLDVETNIIRSKIPEISREACATLLELPRRLRSNPELIKPPSTSEMLRLVPDLFDLVARDVKDHDLGNFYISSVAQNPKDRPFIEKTAQFYGKTIKEALAGLTYPVDFKSLLARELNSFQDERCRTQESA